MDRHPSVESGLLTKAVYSVHHGWRRVTSNITAASIKSRAPQGEKEKKKLVRKTQRPHPSHSIGQKWRGNKRDIIFQKGGNRFAQNRAIWGISGHSFAQSVFVSTSPPNLNPSFSPRTPLAHRERASPLSEGNPQIIVLKPSNNIPSNQEMRQGEQEDR